MARFRSLQSWILAGILVVALVPASLAVLAATALLREIVSVSGTAGPWDAVAETGRALLDAVDPVVRTDTAAARVAETHRVALSESARLSRVYAFVAGRFLELLPAFALGTALVVGVLAWVMARALAARLALPVRELVGWTTRIARAEPLPAPARGEGKGIRELEELRSALRGMAAELEEGRRRELESARLRSWTEMARRVAHELKNPLTPMRMAASTLSRTDDPAGREAVEVLLEEIHRLDEMARSFAQLGRMPEGPPSEIDMEELLGGLVRQHRDPRVRVDLRAASDLPRIQGHYEPLVRVFRNLLANAVEASAGATEPAVAVLVEASDAGVRVRVRDSGPGIPPEALEQIWSPEFTTKPRGTGLGLPLVRQTVRAHGGRVDVTNLPAGGAEFSVVLPLEPAAAPHGS